MWCGTCASAQVDMAQEGDVFVRAAPFLRKRRKEEKEERTAKDRLGELVARIRAVDVQKLDWKGVRWPKLETWKEKNRTIRHPTKKRIESTVDFFTYTEEEGRKLFDEIDQDGDGKVSLEDLKTAMKKRKLPEAYAHKFMNRAKRSWWWRRSIEWEDFRALMHEKESAMLRCYSSLDVDATGQLKSKQVKSVLHSVGVPDHDENVSAMIKFLGRGDDTTGITYGQFRNFLVLLPPDKLSADPGLLWYESATMLPLTPPQTGTKELLLKTALAGGLSSGVSTFMMHPVDTLKTRLQAIPGATIRDVARSIPQFGAKGLYRGIIPATVGSAASHGLRTCAYEASRLFFSKALPFLGEVQVQGLASGIGTALGTCLRIPNEVLKQRLQAGQYPNVGVAVRSVLRSEGPRGLFRGSGVTLAREIPLFVVGMVAYEQLKKGARGSKARELAAWEYIVLGTLAGAIAGVATTPSDVLKTRIMTADPTVTRGVGQVITDLVTKEGPLALFKGAWARAVWIAPMGAMNFSGYELAKLALIESGDATE